MSNNNIINNLRIIPRDSEFLNRKLGSRGEIFFDSNANTLRLFDGTQVGGIKLAKTDLTNVTNADFLAKSHAAGVSAGADALTFKTIAVSGQSNIVADSTTDTLTLVQGSNVTITTDPSTDTITISAVGYTLPTATDSSLGGVKVDGSSITITNGFITAITPKTLVSMDSIQFKDGVAITEFSSDNTLVGNSDSVIPTEKAVKSYVDTAISGVDASTAFSNLTDAASASLTINEVYLPAITMLNVTNQGATAYRFDQYASVNNPTIYAISGTTIAFNLSVTGHSFLIQDGAGTNYDSGLVHVTTNGVVTTGSNAQGKTSGTLYWKIPFATTGTYRYQSLEDVAMVGAITIKNFVSL